MVTDIYVLRGSSRNMTPGESMTYDARIRYWEEEWLSQLLEEALRLKKDATHADKESAATC